jgi:hypothetical protein
MKKTRVRLDDVWWLPTARESRLKAGTYYDRPTLLRNFRTDLKLEFVFPGSNKNART